MSMRKAASTVLRYMRPLIKARKIQLSSCSTGARVSTPKVVFMGRR